MAMRQPEETFLSQVLKLVDHLSPDERRILRQQLEDKTYVVNETDEEWFDREYHRYCESQADDALGIEVVRKALAKIPGALSADFIAERNDR